LAQPVACDAVPRVNEAMVFRPVSLGGAPMVRRNG
jgi:hypothetical protein